MTGDVGGDRVPGAGPTTGDGGQTSPTRDEPQGGPWVAFLIAGLLLGIAGLFLPGRWSRIAVLLGGLLMVVAVGLLLLGGRPRAGGDRAGG